MKGYFSLLTMRPAGVKALWTPQGLDEYRLHQSIWKVFTEDAGEARSFLFREKESDGAPTYYAVSRTAPREDDPWWGVASKAYAPVVAAGDQYAFSVRLNASRSHREGETRREVRHDAVLHHLKQNPDLDRNEACQEAAEAWLGERASRNGFALRGLVVDSWEPRKLQPAGKEPIHFHALDLHGLLQVTDEESFQRLLFEGLGRSRGFGCGLFLVKPRPLS